MDTRDPATDTAALRRALADLADRVAGVRFRLDTAHRDDRRALAGEIVWSIREYLLPRLDDLDAPMVVALVGSTGAGKSTLLNTLAQDEVSRPGATRPTTRVPVAWTHRDHAGRYGRDLLPSFAEADRGLRVVTHDDDRLRGVTIVDTPDLDSVVADHRRLADDLLAAADLCVWVTTAQRYADAIPWDVLRGVRDRALPLLVVCNRVPRDGVREIVADLRRRLVGDGVVDADAGLDVLTIVEQDTSGPGGALPDEAVSTLRALLETVAEPDERRTVVADALTGGLAHVTRLTGVLAEEVASERATAVALGGAVDTAYRTQGDELLAAIDQGRLIRGEVVRRWQAFVGTGELLRSLSAGAGRLRTWAQRVFGGHQRVGAVEGEASAELVAAIVRRADAAATATAGAWELAPAGAALLAGHPGLWRADRDTDARARRLVADWVADLAGLVEEQGEGRRRVAQVASAGVNAVAVALMLAVFAQTGGLTGAEVGITAGAAAVQQRLLEHLFGTAAANRLVEQARDRLGAGVTEVLAVDRARYDRLLATATPDPGTEDDLTEALAAVAGERARVVRRWRRG